MATEHVDIADPEADFIRRSINAGHFQNPAEVVRAGLKLLEAQLAHELTNREELGAMLEAGEASGISDRTPQEIWREAEERYRSKNG